MCQIILKGNVYQSDLFTYLGEGKHGRVYLIEINGTKKTLKIFKIGQENIEVDLRLSKILGHHGNNAELCYAVPKQEKKDEKEQERATKSLACLRDYFEGVTLREKIENEDMTGMAIDAFIGLIVNVSNKGLILGDLNPTNIIFNLQDEKWYIIDGKYLGNNNDLRFCYKSNLNNVINHLTSPHTGSIKTRLLQLIGKGRYRISKIDSVSYLRFRQELQTKLQNV